MKQKTILMLRILILVGLPLLLLVFLVSKGVILFDHSAEYENGILSWQGATWCRTDDPPTYTAKKPLARTKDLLWEVVELEEDEGHTFLLVTTMLEQFLMVRTDYDIPESGQITTISLNEQEIQDPSFCQAIAALFDKQTGELRQIEAHHSVDDKQMKRIYVAYENCPLATHCLGTLGKINGSWYIEIFDQAKVNESAQKIYYAVPREYVALLEQFAL